MIGLNRSLAISCLLAALSSCGRSKMRVDYAREPDPRRSEYAIGVSDVIRINVWKMPELATEARVRPDGTITMPLVGDVPVAGRTPTQVRQEVGQRLSQYVKDETATVTVAVTEVNSYRFTVAGNVERPGVYFMKHFVTVSEAVALAGGPNRFASPEDMVIVRADQATQGQVRKVPIDYTEIRSGDHPERNLVLLPGDTVYIP
jgi:polysaccharide biosynthesis/export protein